MVAAPVLAVAHPVDPPASDLGGDHRFESVRPEPHSLVKDIDAALVQHILDAAE